MISKSIIEYVGDFVINFEEVNNKFEALLFHRTDFFDDDDDNKSHSYGFILHESDYLKLKNFNNPKINLTLDYDKREALFEGTENSLRYFGRL